MTIEDAAQARELARVIEKQNPALAAAILQAVREFEGGKRDNLRIDVGIRYKLEKFEGDRLVETLEGVG